MLLGYTHALFASFLPYFTVSVTKSMPTDQLDIQYNVWHIHISTFQPPAARKLVVMFRGVCQYLAA